MIALSCFDGMSCGRIALDKANIKVDKYYASEIDKYAQIVSAANYPDIVRLGNITKWKEWDIEQPDIVMGGSPCQGFSFAGKQLNFEDERSKLFFVFVDILKHYKPKYFLLENVIMSKESNDVISRILGELYPDCVSQTELFSTGRLEPIEINSALLSAQNRRRLYWTNIKGIEQPKDKGILLKDIIESGEADKDKSYCIDANFFKGGSLENYLYKSRRQMVMSQSEKRLMIKCGAFRGRNPDNPKSRESGLPTEQMLELREDEKTNCLTSVQKDNVVVGFENNKSIKIQERIKKNICDLNGKGNCMLSTLYKGAANNGATVISEDNITWRKLTPIECERLQTVPDNYTAYVSNTQRYKMLGNGWTVDVIAHIFKNIPEGI